MTNRVIRGALLAAFTLAALAIAVRIAFPQAVTNPSNPTSNPNQINVTTSYLYLNKVHYAGAWSSSVSYNSQDLVISASLPYISLVVANLNNTPASSPLSWFPLPAGAASAAWGSITGTLSSQSDLNTALGLALAKASNLSDLANAGTARTNLGLAAVAASGSATDLGTGTLNHARLPSLVSGDIPNNGANTSGLAGTATALAANGTNCSAGSYPLGVDASGNAENCTSLAALKIRAIGYTFDGGGTALVAPLTKYLTVPFGCTLSAWNIAVDTGTATMKTWKIATGTAIPTVTNTLSTSGVSISTGTAIHSTTMTDFSSTTVTANDIFGFNLSASSGATFVNFILECDQ